MTNSMQFDTRCIYYITYSTFDEIYLVEMCEGTPFPGYFAGPFNQQQAITTCAKLNAGKNPPLASFI
jgi:hypothetical protein